MTHLKANLGAVAATVALAAASWAFMPAAHADEQYKADRAYCMSGQASEERNLCLKEAAAAQAERQRGSQPHRKHLSAKHRNTGAPDKTARTPSST